ncbi:MAG TPA: LptF/LptG family permease [Sulfuricurvum sp.]|nr:LptF/LptG family permease [Sulfuricurvum sp.]
MLFFKTISFLYLRYCVIILASLTAFMVGFDLMGNTAGLPSSINLLIIYVVYKWLYAIDMMLPISLVFAFIAALVELIRSNALTAFYALGYSRIKVLAPFLFVATLLIIGHILAHATSFARANEYADNLRETSQVLTPTNNLFFTHEGNYIYFGSLDPLTQRAHSIRVFTFKNGVLTEALSAQEAYYHDHYWIIQKAHLIRPPMLLDLKGKGIVTKDAQTIQVLHDFRPKILDQIYEGKVNFTIMDALDAKSLLKTQNIDLSKVTSSLYRIFITPWFSLMILLIIYTYAPIGARFVNLSFYSFGAILGTLLVWGMLFMSGELSNNKTLSPEMGILAPIVVLGGYLALRLSRFKIKSHKNLSQKG